MLLFGCDQPSTQHSADNCALDQGDVIISEVFADKGVEWLELYNRSTKFLSINRAALRINSRTHILAYPQKLAPGQFLVLANQQAPYVDIVVSSLNIPLDHTRMALQCKATVVHSVSYNKQPQKGQSRAVDGVIFQTAAPAPDALTWCASSNTPGRANPLCGVGFCSDNGTIRAVQPPTADSIAINEVFADPAGTDVGGEWLEVAWQNQTPFDLNGMMISQSNGQRKNSWIVANPSCLAMSGSGFAVIGFLPDRDTPSTVQALTFVYGSPLNNSTSSLRLEHSGIVLDEIQLPAAIENTSWIKSSDGNGFCPERRQTAGLNASPGQSNALCGLACRDNGVWRPIRQAAAGELIVSEVLSDANGNDSAKEWLEIYVNSDQAIDLNDTIIQQRFTDSDTINSIPFAQHDCLPLTPGSYVLIADDAALTGQQVIRKSMTLGNGASIMAILTRDENNQVHEVDTASLPEPKPGRSISLDRYHSSATDNDDAMHFCSSRSVADATLSATPGQINDPCGLFCKDQKDWRPSRLPLSGELFVNEMMQKPPSGYNRWLELQALASFDANHLRLTQSTRHWLVNPVDCLPVEAGQHIVIQEALDANSNDPLVGDFVVNGALNLYLVAREIVLELFDDNNSAMLGILDQASGPGTSDGKSTQLAIDVMAPVTDNGNPANWCVSTVSPTGTPGDANDCTVPR